MAAFEQALHRMRPDISGSAGNENVHVFTPGWNNGFGVYANSRFIHNAIDNLPIFEEVMTQFPEGGACQDRLNRRYFGVYEYRQFPHRPWKPQTTVAESFKDRAQRRPAAST